MRLPSDVGIFVKIASPTASIVWELDFPVLNIFVLNSYLQGSENAFDNPTGASPPPNPAAFPPVVRLCHQPPWHSSLPSSHSPCQDWLRVPQAGKEKNRQKDHPRNNLNLSLCGKGL